MFVEWASATSGHFRDDVARGRFVRAADAMTSTWSQPPQPLDIPTAFGRTRVNAAATTGTTGASRTTPIVLLPMLGATSLSWGSTVEAIDRIGSHRAIYAVDLVTDAGMGRPERPITSSADMASWLDEVLDLLGLGRVHLVGLSYGALVALNQALVSPDRLASVVAVEPMGALVPLRRGTRSRARAAPFARGPRGPRWRRRRLAARTARRLGPAPVEHRAALGHLLTTAYEGFRGRQLRPRPLEDAELDRIITTDPATLILLGGRSPLCHTDRAVERVRSSSGRSEGEPQPVNRVEVVPDTGHLIPIEQPEVFSRRLVWFLDTVERTVDGAVGRAGGRAVDRPDDRG